MNDKIVAEISFVAELRDRWPTKSFNAEAYLPAVAGTPWSFRAELWNAPNADGHTFAWLSFLSPDAPFEDLPLGSDFELRLGRTLVGHAVLKVYPQMATGWEERTSKAESTEPVRMNTAA